jgi:hypothetical protein
MSIVIRDTSPAELLSQLRGNVTDARVTSSGRLRLTVTDSISNRWHLLSWEASCSASDGEELEGRSIIGAELDAEGLLAVRFLDGGYFTLTPNRDEDQVLEDWELLTPRGMVLTFGPQSQWQLGWSDGRRDDALLQAPESS